MLTHESFVELAALLDTLPAINSDPEWNLNADGGPWEIGMELSIINPQAWATIAILAKAFNARDHGGDYRFFPYSIAGIPEMIFWNILAVNPKVTPEDAVARLKEVLGPRAQAG